MAAAGVEFGTRVTRGRNRTNEGVLATMRLLLDAGADINARMVTEPRAVVADAQPIARWRPPVAVDEAVRCRAPQLCRTRPHYMARQRRASQPSSNPCRERCGSSGEGCQRPNTARSREGCRRTGCSPGSQGTVPGNRRPARIADGRQGHRVVIGQKARRQTLSSSQRSSTRR